MTTTLTSKTTTVNLASYTTGNPFLVDAGTTIATTSEGAIFGNSSRAWTLTNAGKISGATYGVSLAHGGAVTNSGAAATIAGELAIYVIGGAGTVRNSGVITGSKYEGVDLDHGGTVVNSAGGKITGADTAVVIAAAAGSVTNAGYVAGRGDAGVDVNAGGGVTNSGTIIGAATNSGVYMAKGGSVANQSVEGLISAGVGVFAVGASAIVSNEGTIKGVKGEAVGMDDGGEVTNADAALITGKQGVQIGEAAGKVVNAGDIVATGGGYAYGVGLSDGGSVTNKAGGMISGIGGAYIGGVAGALTNAGTITASGTNGVYFSDGGVVTNQGAASSLSGGNHGVAIRGAAGTVVNAGTIEAMRYEGVLLGDGGSVTNAGSAALIQGYAGITIRGAAGAVTNSGTISAMDFIGVHLSEGGSVTNAAGGAIEGDVHIAGGAGTMTNAGAIEAMKPGEIGVVFNGDFNDTLINSGTIAGYGPGPAVQFGAGDDHLTLDPGAVFLGGVDGGRGTNTLELAAGGTTGALSGLGGQFTSFQTVSVDAGAKWDLNGTNSVTAGVSLIDSGLLTFSGGLTNAGTIAVAGAGAATIDSALDNTGDLLAEAGTLTVTAAVTGTGGAKIAAGTLDFTAAATFDQDVAFLSGATGTLVLGDGQTYAGTISGFSKTGATALDLADIAYVSGTTKASYSGTTSGGVLTVTSGAEVAHIHLTGDYKGAVWVLSAAAGGGTKIVDPAGPPALATLAFIQTTAGFETRAHAAPLTAVEVGRAPAQAMLVMPRAQMA